MIKDTNYIKRCFDLARLGKGKVSPNPLVGAVIVHDGKIIGEGYHAYFGGPHAEVNAIASVKDKQLLRKSSIYVSLEPCHHHGKTPPCVDALLKEGFVNVIISVTDPNPKVMGKSIRKLKENGVSVKTHILEVEGRAATTFFLTNFEKKRPYIILKFARSVNNVLGVPDRQVWITNPYTKRLVHKWRSEVAAIMVGTNTAKIDNPQLNTRHYFGSSPLRIVLDRQLSLPSSTKLLSDGLPTLVVTEIVDLPINKSTACTYLSVPFGPNLLSKILSYLHQQGIDSLIVEGGATLLNSFITADLWDEARILTGAVPIEGDQLVLAPMVSGRIGQTHKLGDNVVTQIFRVGATS